ncbi:hypothetical protein O6H91_Y295000 [Diphasiastrum complanatum]|nr:hypothetical protein O6H91_Y295000 [Diphasiastrum complanatum]
MLTSSRTIHSVHLPYIYFMKISSGRFLCLKKIKTKMSFCQVRNETYATTTSIYDPECVGVGLVGKLLNATNHELEQDKLITGFKMYGTTWLFSGFAFGSLMADVKMLGGDGLLPSPICGRSSPRLASLPLPCSPALCSLAPSFSLLVLPQLPLHGSLLHPLQFAHLFHLHPLFPLSFSSLVLSLLTSKFLPVLMPNDPFGHNAQRWSPFCRWLLRLQICLSICSLLCGRWYKDG